MITNAGDGNRSEPEAQIVPGGDPFIVGWDLAAPGADQTVFAQRDANGIWWSPVPLSTILGSLQ